MTAERGGKRKKGVLGVEVEVSRFSLSLFVLLYSSTSFLFRRSSNQPLRREKNSASVSLSVEEHPAPISRGLQGPFSMDVAERGRRRPAGRSVRRRRSRRALAAAAVPASAVLGFVLAACAVLGFVPRAEVRRSFRSLSSFHPAKRSTGLSTACRKTRNEERRRATEAKRVRFSISTFFFFFSLLSIKRNDLFFIPNT